MVFLGSIIVMILILSGIWFALSPLFQKIGYKVNKIKEKWNGEDASE